MKGDRQAVCVQQCSRTVVQQGSNTAERICSRKDESRFARWQQQRGVTLRGLPVVRRETTKSLSRAMRKSPCRVRSCTCNMHISINIKTFEINSEAVGAGGGIANNADMQICCRANAEIQALCKSSR